VFKVDVYEGQAKFYREILGISYELGSRLLKDGILLADAQMADGRPLFSLSETALKRHWAGISKHKALRKRANKNIYGRQGLFA
jgi:hypothetical protein